MLKSQQNATSTVVAKINDVSIIVINNGEKRVPISPICHALGINSNNQIEKIKNDEILSSTHMLSISVGADGKEREMFTIPLMFVFGWLFTINPKNVSPKARENVIKYKLECYKALYYHFIQQSEFLQEKEELISQQLEIVKDRKHVFNTAKEDLRKAEKQLIDLKDYDFPTWRAHNMVQKLPFVFDQDNNSQTQNV